MIYDVLAYIVLALFGVGIGIALWESAIVRFTCGVIAAMAVLTWATSRVLT